MQQSVGKFFGQKVKLPNERLPFFAIVFMGILAIGSVLYWRHYAFLAAEAGIYQPSSKSNSKSSQMKSSNYQIDFVETSPTIK